MRGDRVWRPDIFLNLGLNPLIHSLAFSEHFVRVSFKELLFSHLVPVYFSGGILCKFGQNLFTKINSINVGSHFR